MATTIVTKNGTGAPTDSDLVAGELAVDLTNGRLYTTDLDSGGTVIEIGLNPSGNVDVTGTVTADGLTVDGSTTFTGNTSPASDEVLLNLSSLNGTGTAGNMLRFTDLDPTATNNGSIGKIQFYSEDTDAVVVEIEGQNADASPDGRLIFKTAEGTTLRKRINIENNGDISFYEDTGTTAKLFWDASAESLGIGTAAPSAPLDIKLAGTVTADIFKFQRSDGLVAGVLNYNGTDGTISLGTTTTHPLAFDTDGSERMRIDASGNVGINTTPKAWTAFTPVLQIKNASTGGGGALAGTSADNFRMFANTYYDGVYKRLATGFATQYAQESGTHVWSYAASGAADSTFTWSEAMRIDANGNVGIGMTPPSDRNLAVYDSTNSIFSLHNSTTGTAATDGFQLQLVSDDAYLVNYEAGGVVAFFTAPSGGSTTERMRIDASGNLMVGTTDSSPYTTIEGFVVALNNGSKSAACFGADNVASRTVVNIVNPNGSVGSITTNASATAYNTSSDQRLKENIVDAPSASDDIDAIQVRSFDWKSDGSHQKYGMVAQELQTVAPEAVSVPEDPEEMMGVDYSKLVPMMLKEIQSLRARVAQLES